jgi:hypothetical protein
LLFRGGFLVGTLGIGSVLGLVDPCGKAHRGLAVR